MIKPRKGRFIIGACAGYLILMGVANAAAAAADGDRGNIGTHFGVYGWETSTPPDAR